jgi:hypothetical protein
MCSRPVYYYRNHCANISNNSESSKFMGDIFSVTHGNASVYVGADQRW